MLMKVQRMVLAFRRRRARMCATGDGRHRSPSPLSRYNGRSDGSRSVSYRRSAKQAFDTSQQPAAGTTRTWHRDVRQVGSNFTQALHRKLHQLDAHAGLLHNRSEEHTSELQSLMRISYAVFCLKKKNKTKKTIQIDHELTLLMTKQATNQTNNKVYDHD